VPRAPKLVLNDRGRARDVPLGPWAKIATSVTPWTPEDLQQLYGAAAQAIATAEELIRTSEQLISKTARARTSGPDGSWTGPWSSGPRRRDADSAPVAGAPAARPAA
jgi:hypothetical protein